MTDVTEATRAVRARVVGYHDVEVEGGAPSGFGTAGARRYALPESRFRDHLAALAAVDGWAPVTLRTPADLPAGGTVGALTVDDGGACAARVADLWEERGWRGHFFVVTALIGTPGFVPARTLVELAARGHVVGSHSHTHPDGLAAADGRRIAAEWRDSLAILEDLLGTDVTTASVPGGSTSGTVVAQAAAAGVRVLFTSDPTGRVVVRDGCAVIGRYQLYRSDGPRIAAGAAHGDVLLRARRRAAWEARRGVHRVLGPRYLRVRAALLDGRTPARRTPERRRPMG